MTTQGRRYRASREQAYTIAELAAIWKMNADELRRAVRDGDFPGAFKIGPTWRIPREAARAWREARTPFPITAGKPDLSSDELAYTVPDLAAAWRMNVCELRRMTCNGSLRGAFRIGRTWRIPKNAARIWREERTPVPLKA